MKRTVSKRQVYSGEPKRSVSSNSLYKFFISSISSRETKSWWNSVNGVVLCWEHEQQLVIWNTNGGVWGGISILQRNCKQSSLIQKSYFSFYCSSFIVAWNFLHDLVYIGIRLNYFSFFSLRSESLCIEDTRQTSRESEEVSLIRNCLVFRRRKWSQDEAVPQAVNRRLNCAKLNVLETLI